MALVAELYICLDASDSVFYSIHTTNPFVFILQSMQTQAVLESRQVKAQSQQNSIISWYLLGVVKVNWKGIPS